MFNKKYKKGMADAAKAYEAFGKKQEEALKHILEEVRQGKRDLEAVLKELNGNIDGIYDYLQSKEKAKLYTVYTPFDIKELDQHARLFLVGVLFALTTDKLPNENQQNYIRAVKNYLEIKDPPFGTNPMAIENIEDIPTQKAIYQTILEYLRLQDGDSYDETEYQQEFLDAFNLNSRIRKEIQEHVELLYTATGAKGLAEKYGYVPEKEDQNGETENSPKQNESFPVNNQYADPEFVKLQPDYADKAVKNTILIYSCTETRNFCFLLPSQTCLDKRNGSIISFKNIPHGGIEEIETVDYTPDTIAISGYVSSQEQYYVGIFDLAKDRYTEVDHGKNRLYLLCVQGQYLVYGEKKTGDIFVFDLSDKSLFSVPKPSQIVSSNGFSMLGGISGNHLFLSANGSLYQIDLTSADLSAQQVSDFAFPVISSGVLKICGNWLYIIDYGGDHLQIFKGNLNSKAIEKIVSIFDNSESKIYPVVNNISNQYLTYRVEHGRIFLLKLENGKIQELVPRSKVEPHLDKTIRILGMVGLLGFFDAPAHLDKFPILGSWMYFKKEDDDRVYKINIDYPSRVSTLRD